MECLLVVEILNLCHQLGVELWWNVILLQNTVQNVELLLILSVRLIVISNNGGERSRCETEKDNTNELQEDTNDSLGCTC